MNIFVGNLSSLVTSDHIWLLFNRFGKVESASIIKDGDSGRSLGFGFVCMEKSCGENAISNLRNINFMNRFLDVAEA